MLLTLLLATEPATVEFHSSSSNVIVGRVVERRVESHWHYGTVPGQTFPYKTEAVLTQDICTVPCTRTFEPGFYEFYATGYDVALPATRVELREGSRYQLTAYPTSLAAQQLATALLVGGFLSVTGGLAMTIPGTGFQRPGLGLLTVSGGLALGALGYRSSYNSRPYWEFTEL